MSFHTSLAGLNAATTKLATTSNNIANVATDTFKRSDVQFADVYAKSSRSVPTSTIGQGVLTANISQQFTQGALSTTNRSLDLAISGNGFYMTRPINEIGLNNQIIYTRGGSFTIDPQNFVVNNSGDRLLVENPNNLNEFIDLNIPPRTINQFTPTSLISQQINLPSNSSQPPIEPFDRSNRNSYNFNSNFTFIDSDGQTRTGTIYYTKSSDPEDSLYRSWDTKVFIGDTEVQPLERDDLQLLDKAKTSTGFKDIEWKKQQLEGNFIINENPIMINSEKYFIEGGDGNGIFGFYRMDSTGKTLIGNGILNQDTFKLNFFTKEDEDILAELERATFLSTSEVNELVNSKELQDLVKIQRSIPSDGRIWFNASGKIINSSSSIPYDIGGQQILFDRTNTQISSGGFNILSQEQNGRPDGDLIGIRIDTNGDVIASYANGQNNLVGSLRLTTFANPNGLRQIGDTRYLQTEAAGDFRVGIPGSEGFGLVQSGAVERSNVDLTTELVDLIMAQRNFQANSKAIEIDNTMTKSIIDSVRS